MRSRWARLVGFFVLPIALGSLYMAERALQNDYALLLYHAQRVTLFIDIWPRLYAVPIGLALSGSVAALVARDAAGRQAAAGVLLLLGSGYAPHAPGPLADLDAGRRADRARDHLTRPGASARGATGAPADS